MNSDRFELVYGYVHCVGRTEYHFGYARDEAAARRWAEGDAKRLRAPDADPIRWCPVHHCHMKRQHPWRGYRTPAGELIIEPMHEKENQAKKWD